MLEDIRLAFQGIWSHKLRSALTMLGIIIGIGSIIAIVSTIKGTNEQIKKNLVGAGNNAVNIQLYQGDWTLDLSYQEVPDGIPEISDQVLGEIQTLDEVESAALYHRRNEYDAVYAGSQIIDGRIGFFAHTFLFRIVFLSSYRLTDLHETSTPKSLLTGW